jgi:hypothetical protein
MFLTVGIDDAPNKLPCGKKNEKCTRPQYLVYSLSGPRTISYLFFFCFHLFLFLFTSEGINLITINIFQLWVG